MPRTRAIVVGALTSALLCLTGCVSVDGTDGGKQKSSSPISSPPATARPNPSASSSQPTQARPPRPSDLLAEPAQDPCALVSEARARKITGEKLIRRPEAPWYMPDRLRDGNEPAYWICHTSFHLHKPIEGLAVLTYDTTSVTTATRKYNEIVAHYKREGYYEPRADVIQANGAERTTLLAFDPQEHHDYNGYGGVVVLSRDTVFTILWTTKNLAVLKALAEEATATTAVAGK